MTTGCHFLVADEDWPEQLINLRGGPLAQLNVYKMMANHPSLLLAWSALRDHLVVHSALTPQQSELVILRTGWRWRSRYEWVHHVSRSRRVGLSDDVIARCARSAPAEAGGDALLLDVVDALMERGKLSEGLLARLQDLVGLKGSLDVMATIGMYTTLAFLLETFAVPVDDDVAAELAGDPLAALGSAAERPVSMDALVGREA